MLIVNFISGKDLGGPKQSYLLYNEVFLKLGFEVVPIIRSGAKFASLIRKQGLKPVEINYVRSVNFLFKKVSSTIISKSIPEDTNLIFVHKQIDLELIKEAIKDKNIPIVGVIHGFNAKHINNADVLIAVSNKVKNFLINNGYKKPIFVIPNMVKIDKNQLVKKIETPVKIGSMGVFRRKKGFHILIKALAILNNRGISFEAVIAGRGKRVAVYKLMCKKYNLCNKLKFRGWIDNEQRDDFFDSLDIYVLPSRTESFGMVVVEAMAHKKVVVATRCGGPEEIITHEYDGFLVKNQDAVELANKLEYVINNIKNLSYIQDNAYITVKDNYSLEVVEKSIKKLIKQIGN